MINVETSRVECDEFDVRSYTFDIGRGDVKYVDNVEWKDVKYQLLSLLGIVNWLSPNGGPSQILPKFMGERFP